MQRRTFLGLLSTGALTSAADSRFLELSARSRRDAVVEERTLLWRPSQTAIIICDMWDDHYCKNSAIRVGEMAPRMNAIVAMARKTGIQIIHAPSGTMDVYKDTPQRKRLRQVARVTPPVPVGKWCYLDPGAEGPLPIDDAKQACDDDAVGPVVRRYNRQNAAIKIAEPDGVSDDGNEIYSFFVKQGIRNVVLMGVHTNMCVLGRPFGIRQQTRLGMNAVLARDLTDCMYDPKERPYVSHWRGTELVVEHVERYWCPSILSADLTRTVGG